MYRLFVPMRATGVLLHHHILLLVSGLLLLTASAHTLKLQGMLWQHIAPLAANLCLSPACLPTALARQDGEPLAGDLLLW